MSGQQFTFPPPPAPPQVVQSYPGYSQPPQGQHANRRGSSQWDRGRHGQGRGGRGNSRGNSRGDGHGGYPSVDFRQTRPQDGGSNTTANSHRTGGYPLPNYPAVQLPQYPANLGQDYGRLSANYTANDNSITAPPVGYPSYAQNSHHYYKGQGSSHSNGYGYPTHVQSVVQGSQSPSRLPYNSSDPAYQPTPMAPPMRMGFEGQNCQASFHPQPTASGTMSFQNGLSNSNSPTYENKVPVNFQSNRHDSPNSFPGHRTRGQKRGRGEAFGHQRNHHQRPRAAPAVPSFGGALPLPVKPPAPKDHARMPRKKKRKHNQLGLTPKTEEHESSEEEEDDEDEESRLASVAAASGAGSQSLQFEYKSRTLTLQSSSEIASWIEERKARYPTKARAAEAADLKRRSNEAQKAASQARRQVQEKQRAENKAKLKRKVELEQKKQRPKDDKEDAAAKAKRKVEKLRKQLEKEEKRVARAEAEVARQNDDPAAHGREKYAAPGNDINKKRKRTDNDGSDTTDIVAIPKSEADQLSQAFSAKTCGDTSIATVDNLGHVDGISKSDSKFKDPPDNEKAASNPVADLLTPMSQPPVPDDVLEPQRTPSCMTNDTNDLCEDPEGIATNDINQVTQDRNASTSDLTSEMTSTDSEELTSSSGSSSSGSDSNSEAPDQDSSKRNGPERVPAPKREKPRSICRDFLRSGRCKRGGKCQYRHELPERGSRNVERKEAKIAQGRPERVGLYQRLVEQEKEKEDHEVLKAIIDLGDKGLFDEEASSPGTAI